MRITYYDFDYIPWICIFFKNYSSTFSSTFFSTLLMLAPLKGFFLSTNFIYLYIFVISEKLDCNNQILLFKALIDKD